MCKQSQHARLIEAAGTTAARLPDTLASSPLQMVVIGQFLPYCNVSQGKYAYAGLAIDKPLLCLAVGLAGMIDEACPVALPGGVNDFQGTVHPQEISASIVLSPAALRNGCCC